MSKHTPGPWNANAGPHGKMYILAPSRAVCEMLNAEAIDTLPDARLIAAAPEMLFALEQILKDWDSVSPDVQVPDEINVNEHWDSARAALAKARGE